MTDHEATAKRLLPCECEIVQHICDVYEDGHYIRCAAYFRPAVAAALAERDAENEHLKKHFRRHAARERVISDMVFQHIKHGDEKHQEWLRVELDNVLTREGEPQQKFDDLIVEIADLRAKLATVEHNNSWLNDECKKLKARGKIEGLECGAKLQCSWCASGNIPEPRFLDEGLWHKDEGLWRECKAAAIAAEIAKAGKP